MFSLKRWEEDKAKVGGKDKAKVLCFELGTITFSDDQKQDKRERYMRNQ